MPYKAIINKLRQSQNVYSLAGNMGYAVFSLVTFLLMVRLLDKETYGQWIIYITAASIIDMFRMGLTGTGAIRLISTTTKKEQKQYIAASYQLGIAATILVALLFYPAYFSLKGNFSGSYFLLVLLYYPLLSVSNLPYYQAFTINQGLINFKRVMILRGMNGFLTFVFVASYILLFQPTIEGIIISNIIANLICSIISMALKWDYWHLLGYYNKDSIKKILHFGKYSSASFISSNLLRSSDTIILSLSATMGATAIAIYAIPLKFVELVEIPLRSFTSTALPKLSSALTESKEKFNNLLGSYISVTSLLFFPIILALFFFSSFFLKLIGGMEYANDMELQHNILYIIIFYIFLLPFDRYSGVALFALEKPKINFIKISIMLVANIIFDLFAVFMFESLEMVALATVLFTLIGLVIGWYFIFDFTKFRLISISNFYSSRINYISYNLKTVFNGIGPKK